MKIFAKRVRSLLAATTALLMLLTLLPTAALADLLYNGAGSADRRLSLDGGSAEIFMVEGVISGLRGLAVGETTVTVTINNALTDTVNVTVIEPAPVVMLEWHGEKTETMIFNSRYTERYFDLTVETTGYYALYSEGDTDPWMEIYDQTNYIAYADDTEDSYNFYEIVFLEAGKTYTMVIGDFGIYGFGAAAVPVTLQAATEVDIPATGVTFVDDSLTTYPGAYLDPEFVLGWDESFASITSSDPSVAEVMFYTNGETGEEIYDGIETVGVGTATLTVTTESGATDTMTVIVEPVVFFNRVTTLAVGDILWLDFAYDYEDTVATITSSDPAVVQSASDGSVIMPCVQAVGAGTATLTVTTESGDTGSLTLTVTEARALTENEKAAMSFSVEVQTAYAFTPASGGTYAFQTLGAEYAYVIVYDEDMSVVDVSDTNHAKDCYLETELTAGETYYAMFGSYGAEDAFEVMVSRPVAATTVTIGVDALGLAKAADDTYYIYTDTELAFYEIFGEAENAAVEPAEYTLSDASVLDYIEDYDAYAAAKPGTTTVTVTTENGLTDTITVVVIDEVERDINLDGVYDVQDLDTAYAALKGKVDIGYRLYLLEVNGDNKIDLQDIRAMYEALAEAPIVLGNVDGEGEVTASDALMALQIATDKITPTAVQALAADVDANGQITANDALMILQYATQKIGQFPADAGNNNEDNTGGNTGENTGGNAGSDDGLGSGDGTQDIFPE